jgi:hypothetical protein
MMLPGSFPKCVMKNKLISSAVFGLVPLPPLVAIHSYGNRHVVNEDVQSWQGVRDPSDEIEKVATEKELARLRRELGINVGLGRKAD